MNKSLQKQVLFWCFFFTANLALAQWGPIRIEFDETDFPAATQTLITTATPGPIVVGEYDVVVPGATCGAGTEYTAGQDGIDDLRVTATLVRGPGLMWTQTEGDYDLSSNGSFRSDYNVDLGESRPNDFAYIKYEFEFINGLENNIDANSFNTRHTSTNGSSEGYEWTQVTLNNTPINEANIGNYTNEDYSDITGATGSGVPFPNGITMSEFLSGMPAGSVAPGGLVTPGWWAVDDFNTTILDGPEAGGTNPDAGNGGPSDDQIINGAADFGLGATTLVTHVTYYFGLTDVAFDTDGDGFTQTNTLPAAGVTYFDIGAACSVATVCPTIGAISDPADICEGETFDISATGLVGMDMTTNMEADFGINFVSFSGTTPPADPYAGGTSLGIVPFGNLTTGDRGTEATLTAAGGMLAAGTYNICAVLDPVSADMTCRPSQCIELTVNAAPAGPGVMGVLTFCEGDRITPITAIAVPGGAATFNFYSDAGLTTTSSGTINGADYTSALRGPGTEQVFITQTINGCEGPATGVTITVNAAPAAPMVADITVCDGEDTTITPSGGGGGGAGGAMTLGMENFDGGGVGFSSTGEFNDGTSDHFGTTNGSNITNVSGNYSFQDGTNIFWAAEDVDDNGGPGINPAIVTLNPINIAGFSSVEVCIDMAAGNNNPPGSNGYDENDHVFVQYSTDVNPTFTNGYCFNYLNSGNPSDVSNEPLYSDPNCDGDVSDGVLMTVTGQTFCFTIPDTQTLGAGAATLTVNVEVAMGSGNEEIAFDNIVVTGTSAPMMAGTFNFYDANPNPGPANLLAGPAGSYDPGTTVATSPQSVFVTTTNSFGCESDATEVVVTVNALPAAPTFTGTTTFCEGDMITPITAMGDAGATFEFFSDAALTMVAPGTVNGAEYTTSLTGAGTETVFITQTVMGCQSPAAMVDIEVLAAPAAPTFTGTVDFCDGEMITPVTAMGDAGATFTFYGDAALTTPAPGTVNGADYTAALTGPGMETVYFTQTNGMGCESAAASATITVVALPDPPMVMDITVCDGGDTEIIPTAAGGGGGLMTVYLETFDTQGEGIAGGCSGMDPATCATNVPPANGQWSVTGDASGLTATSDFFNTFAGVLNAQDTDTEICFLSQVIDISTLVSADFSVLLAERGTHEATDFVDVTLIVDGTPMLIPNWMGLGDADHTLIDDFNTTTVTATGITGSTLQIQICVMNNAGSEDIDIDDIMVSGLGAGGPLYNFYDANPVPGPANLLAGMANTFDPMTTVATSPQSVFVTVIDPVTGCESDAVEVIVTVNPNPVLDIVATDVVGCPGDATGTATVTATVGTAPYSFTYTTTNGSGDDGDGDGMQTMLTAGTYTVVATDANGCTATADFTINDAVDGDAPMIMCPPSPIEIDCGESTATANTGIATATDVCSPNPVISFVDNLVLDGCGGRTGTLTRIFTATDEAGNASTCEQIINIVDNTPPTFTAPAAVTIECTDDPNDLTLTGMPTDLMDNCNASGIENLWINEFHYDNAGTDANEFIELAGTAGLNLTGYAIVFYNGSNGTNYGIFTLPGGIIPDEGNGFGAFSFLIPGIQNGAPDGIALVDPNGAVLEFISYEGSFTAVDGPAIGITSTDIGVSETGGTTATSSLQKIGTGTSGGDFLWSGPTDPSSPGLLNVNQTVTPIVFPVPTFTGFTDVSVGDPNCPNGSTITRTFTVTDACGNTATATQTITIDDTTAPVTPAAPGDLVVDCPQDIPAPPVLVATDACGGNIMSTVSSVIINRQCATRFTMVRTFTFDDGCGNTSSVTQNIEVTDPGTLTVEPLPDHIVDCEVNIQPQEFLVQATSPCGNPPTVTSVINGPFGELGCPGTFYNVVYTVADDCGRSVQTTQRFTIQNDGPEFVCPVDICIIECPQDNDMIQAQFDAYAELATVTSSCSENAEMTITNNFSPNGFIPNNCGNGPIAYAGTKEYQIVTFQATDPCGRSTSCTALVVVVDNEAPVFQGTPTLGIAECDDRSQIEYDAFIQSRFAMLNATDACSDDATLTYSYTPATPNFICGANGYAITEVFLTVTDDCGNSNTVEVHFKLKNNFPATITIHPDRFVQCDMPIPAFDTPVITNACGTTNVTFEDSVINGSCSDARILIRTYTVTDGCGNSTTKAQRITIVDTLDPIASNVPEEITVDCNGTVPIDMVPTFTDNCTDEVTVTVTDGPIIGDCASGASFTRTYTGTDDCGNATTVTQMITIMDDTAPVAPAAPANVTVSCVDNLPQPVDLTATDNCTGAITVSPSAVITPGACNNQLVMVRTWTFADDCGNTSSVSQTITVNDDIAPEFTFVPAGMSGQCMGTPMEFEDATATDNCSGPVTITFIDDTDNSGPCGITVTRTWTATDACGNASTASATMSTGDSEAPVASNVPSNTTIDCGATPIFGSPTFTDNCATDVTVVVTNSTTDGDCDGEFVFTRTWTATDDCDNTTIVSQTITSQDTEGPVFVSVPTGTVVCDGGNFDEPEVTDNCSSFTVTFVDDTNGTGCNGTITRTYTATDDCGNATMATATLTIVDNEAPVFTNVPGTLDVDCDEVPEFTPPTVEDNCGDVELTFVETESGELCDEGFSRKRVWTATDNCGNTATVETAIWVNKDNTPPVFTFVPPTNIMINCEDFPPTFGNVEVEDDCSGVTITFEDDYLYGDENSCDNGENFDYRRTWTATDGCGNESTAEQKFWVMAGPMSATISGTLMTEEDEMTDNVMMTLESSNAINLSQLSTDGNFVFPVILNQNYTLTPERDDDHLNGITTYDLVLLGRHLLEIQPLDSPYKLIAADINNSGSVTTLDMIALRRLILHIDESMVNNTSWRFVESEYVFADPMNPFASTFPEVSNFNGITQSQIADFMAIKIGDLNGSAAANALAAGDTRSSDGDLVFQLDDADLRTGEQYEVAFKARDFAAVEGYQYTLNLSGLEVVDVKAGALRGLTIDNFGMTNLDRGILTTSWNTQTAVTVADDEVLFTLVVEATQAVKLSEALRVSSDLTKAEGYSEASDKLAVSLRFGEEGTVGAEAFTLYQNRPNPFGAETTISFSLPTAMDATLTIYDVSGRVLKQVTRNYAAGYNEELIERNELNGTGVLYYQLETATETATKKMILVN